MSHDALLTQDELDFIQTMHQNPLLNVRDASSSLMVNGMSQIRDLLTRLAAHEQVTIQAQFANQQMSFPLRLVEDEFHAKTNSMPSTCNSVPRASSKTGPKRAPGA